MFSTAVDIAKGFTFPMIISFRQYDGKCNCGLGAFVVVNEDGWAVTANHIFVELAKLSASSANYNAVLAQRKQIENDSSLKKNIQNQQLRNIPIPRQGITHISVLLGYAFNAGLGQVFQLPEVDLAAFKINNFDKNSVARYPIFKNPASPMLPGTSLCKLGYPFHEIQPTFNNLTNMFDLPPGSLPVPLFPLDGIYTRKLQVMTPAGAPPFPYSYLETSSPGLRGHSGGPTFDIDGNIWAIQSQTFSYPLGFGENAGKGKEAEHMKNQYLNVGWGVHSETITNFLTNNGINFLTSPN